MHPTTLRALTQQFSQPGRLDKIYVRPDRGQPCLLKAQVLAIANRGLAGDRATLHPSTQTHPHKPMAASDK